MADNMRDCTAITNASSARFRIVPSRPAGALQRAANAGRYALMASPTHRGRNCTRPSVLAIRTASTFSDTPAPAPVTVGSSSRSSRGASKADDPASSTINPMARDTSPFATAVNGGPNGAPGQTATTMNPAATIGWTLNANKSPTVAAGTTT